MTEAGYAAGWRVVRLLPQPLAARLFSAAADRALRRGGQGVTRLAANLRTVVGDDLPEPEFRLLLKAAVRSYARYWLELFLLPDRSKEQILDGFQVVEGLDRLQAAVADGRGVILALPHTGNWDAAGAWVAAQGWPIVTVAERLRPEGVFERFMDVRRGLGMEILPLTGGDRSVLEALAERLRQGHVAALVSDRDLPGSGVEVTFFGRTATMPPGPALLALRTGAPLMTVSLWYGPDRVCARVDPPLAPPLGGSVGDRVRLLTQAMAGNFAAGIAAHPADWHMLQRVWRDPATRCDESSPTSA
ncbi:MAG: phosphatidylinositol mannoside acyltransferase [Micromonosporaceae bacterium]|nr:phosphatidylinositol mannoside acyltransferase [Micromonosporaceae bacterium]